MNVPNPPFRTVTEELLYNIYLKLQGGSNTVGLTADDLNTIAKLNAILQDGDLVSAEQFANSIAALKGNVPTAANTLEKLYNIIQGITFLKQEDVDTIAELNAIITDADLVRVADLAELLVSLNLKRRTIQFYFADDHWDDDHDQSNSRDTNVIRGKINSLSHDFTNELSGVSYKSRIDTSNTWVNHSTLAALQTWVNTNIAGDEHTGTKYWIKCVAVHKAGHDGEAVNFLAYNFL